MWYVFYVCTVMTGDAASRMWWKTAVVMEYGGSNSNGWGGRGGGGSDRNSQWRSFIRLTVSLAFS